MVLREAPYGPFGGLPEQVRFDRGKDVLSRTVATALTALDADLTLLPPYSPHPKGTAGEPQPQHLPHALGRPARLHPQAQAEET
ncbi:transposase family protein [Streptomyces boncukensis]|uniref:Transposase family protein n=1 Tax=Streptomyces boncukensis TaxID=2711219 RepID=A0A6G4XAH9_9ACTN|nr:transposase family protein [Streptomyces boncukensis]NGO73847.1 transposase family protein [Streptomyces boncukensis]